MKTILMKIISLVFVLLSLVTPTFAASKLPVAVFPEFDDPNIVIINSTDASNQTIRVKNNQEETPIAMSAYGFFIVDASGNPIGNKTLSVGETLYVSVKLNDSVWHRENTEYGVWYFAEISEGWYEMENPTALWAVNNRNVQLSSGSQDGAIICVTAKSAGTSVLSVTVPCIWLCGDFSTPVNMSASIQITVREPVTIKPEKDYCYPFEGIDPYTVPNPFGDVSASNWFYESVMLLYAAGILDGLNGQSLPALYATPQDQYNSLVEGTGFLAESYGFAGNKKVFGTGSFQTRGNTVLKIYNAHKKQWPRDNMGSFTTNPFSDINDSNNKQKILWASAKGVVNGYPDNTFRPNRSITREEFCAIILRHAKLKGISMPSTGTINFTDSYKISTWAYGAVVACSNAGIVNGYPGNYFDPKATIRTEEAAHMIRNYIEYCNKVSG